MDWREETRQFLATLELLISRLWTTITGLFRRYGSPSFRLKVHTIVAAETFGAHEQILQRMKNKVELIPAEPADCEVVLIFCVVNTRVGSDVEDAMSIPETAREKPVFLVVMYHTTEEDLQTDGTQWRTIYENATFHTEVLFHQTKDGLLKCNRNTLAIQELVDKLENHVQNIMN